MGYVSALIHLPRMFLSMDFVFEKWVVLVAMDSLGVHGN